MGASLAVTSSLTLSVPSASVGSGVSVSAQGLPASAPYTVLWDWVPVGCGAATSLTSSVGGFTCSLTVPQTVAGGHTVSLEAGGITLTTTATLTVVPTLTLSSARATVGSYDVLSGSGFWENARVSVLWAPGAEPLCSATTADGGFSCLIVIPAGTAGAHTVTVRDLSEGSAKVAPVSTSVWVVPSLGLNPGSGSAGSALTVTGSGFAASAPVTLTWDGATLPCASATLLSSEVGGFSCSTLVPAGATGGHVVAAADASGAANQAQATFWTLPSATGGSGARPAATCNSGCSISLSTSSGPVGTTVTVSGTSFAATAKVTVTWSPNAQGLCTATTSSGGAFSCSFVVPPAVQGAHTVTAADNSTPSNFNTASFSVTAQVTLSASSGIVGYAVTASGSGFAGTSAITVTWSPGSVVVCRATANATGSFTCSFQVPSDVQGSHTVTGTDASANSAAATFSVVPSVSLSAASGAVGSSVTVSGAGFAGSSATTITFDSATVTCTQGSITTTSAGAFTCTFTVPPAVIGAHTVAGKDAASNSASAAFTVISTIALSPSSGPVGTTVTVTGHGFAASSSMTGTWAPSGSGSFCTSTSSNATGDFTCTFSVPAAVAGKHLVTLTDGQTNTASANFTVTSQVSLNFASGVVGNTPTITGSGFAASSTVTVTWSPSGSGTLCTATSSALGAFSCTFTVPSAAQGAHTVTATDASSNSASTAFTVGPSVSISPTSGIVGSSATVSGQGYTSGASVTVGWSGSATFTCSVSGSVSATGTWSCSVTIPHSAQGSYTITATESTGSPSSATTSFTVLPALAVSPSSASYQTLLTVTATGFGASLAISISIPWTSGTGTCSTTTTSSGDVSCNFLVPATVAGRYTISATDSASNSATTSVTIGPLVTLSVTSGPVGTTVTVTGNGFAATSSITLLWDASTTLSCSSGSVTTSSVGAFTCTSITVPAAVAGAHTVSAHDAASPTANSASATFTIISMISINPTSGLVGSSVLVSGTGFAGSASISVTWAPSGSGTLCSATSGASGSFSCTFTVPAAYQGAHGVKASDGTNTASTLFTVFPELFVSPTTGEPFQTTIAVTGTGFGSSVGYTVSVTWTSGPSTCTGSTSASGGLTGCSITVPPTVAGTYTVTGVDSSTNHSSASATFTVTPDLFLGAFSGPVGTTVFIEGFGFAASSTTSLKWGLSQPLTCVSYTFSTSCTSPPQATFSTDIDGSFDAAFVVPPSTAGSHTVSATDASSNSASISFTTTTSLAITVPSLASGSVGTSVTVVGNGYAGSSTLSVTFASVSTVTVCSLSTNATGSFTCSFNVPPAVAGPHSVTGTDASSNAASATFTVVANLALSPSSGIVGSTFVATGTGYAGLATISATFDGSAIACSGAPIKSSASGGFNCTLTVPASVAGSHTVRGSDGTNAASATFSTVPSITLSLTSGIVGSSTTATGTGFAGSSAISMAWDVSTPLACTVGSVTTAATGGFSCTFVVPAAVHGAHTVTATDAASNSASTPFAVSSSVSLSPTSGQVGTSVTATGAGYAGSATVSVTWSPGAGVLCTASSSTLGGFACTFVVPHGVMGAHTVTATDASSNSATATFTVTPSLALSPSSGIVGTSSSVVGAGFPAAATYAVTYDGASVSCTPTGATGATGDFACAFTVPASPAGANSVVGTAGIGSASATFTVVPAITLSPTSGDVGAPVTATGTGFAASSSVTFSWDVSTSVACTGGPVTTGSAGGFSCVFDVPPAVKGSHTFAAKDAATNAASATFTVTQSIQLVPSSGVVGNSINVVGSGFAGSSAYTVTWSPAGLVLCSGGTTSALGSFSCSFTVPPAVEGAHTVTAADAVPNSASATFTVHSSLALSPGSGIVGASVTATGNGFGGALPITVTWSPAGTLCSTGSNSTGFFSCVFAVPAATHGFHTVSAADTAPNTASASYFVDAALTLSPVSGLVGSTSTATGTGFSGTASVTLVWSMPTTSLACTSGSLTTSATGGFTCAFTIPTAPIGPHTVTATDTASNSATATYTVGPFVTISPASGRAQGYGIVGTTVTASGSGFTAGDLISVTWTPGTLCTGTANGLGSFTCSAVIPATAAAQYTITATDAHSNSATTLLTVVPALVGAPNGLRAGANIWINGTGFYASQSVNVVWTPAGSSGYSICPSTSTQANGSFTCGPFTLPRQAAGPVQIVAYDAGLQANFTYDLTTNLTVSIAVTAPTSQPPTDVGVTLTFSATASLGFTPYASYAWAFGDGTTATTTSATVTHAYGSASGAGGYTATVTVTDHVGSTASASMPVVVYADPSATTPAPSRPSADVGQAVSFATTESGGVPGGITYTWNGLPLGCTGTSTATVVCPSVPSAGTLSISVSVTDGPYSGIGGVFTSGVLLFTVYADPTVNVTAAPASADVGQHTTFSASVGGGAGLPTYAWSGLPSGCPSAPATGSVACTVTTPGTTTVDVTVTDANGFSVTARGVGFTVYADPALATPTASVGSADVGQPVTFSDTPTSSGAGSLVWSWSSLPSGCSGASGSLTCNPAGAGTFSVQASVTDANGVTVSSAALAFTVYADPSVSIVPSVASADIGQGVVFSASSSGGSGGLSYSWSGLPAGCPSAPSSASVSCASVSTAATTLVSVALTDSNRYTATSNVVTFSVYADPTVTVTASPASTDIGQSVTFTAAAASGTGTYTYSWSGLPSGCPASPTTSVVTCTTSAAATTSVTASVTDSNLKSVTSSGLSFTVFLDPTVSASESRASADAGQVVTFTASAGAGSGAFSYAWSGLPSGCSGTTASVACVAPTTVTSSANFLVSVKVVDSNGVGATSGTVTLTVYADPTISASASRSSADDGQTVVFSAVSTLGSGTNSFSWTGLPATGCSSPSAATVTCVIASGVSSTFSASATVTDSDGLLVTSGAVPLSTFVDPTIATPTSSVRSADVGQGVTFSVTTTPGSGAGSVAWANLPTGCASTTAATATCSSVTSPGTVSVSATYTDSNGFAVTSAALSFTVFADPLPSTPSASATSADVGQSVTFTSTVTLGSGGTTWTWSGLPSGCPAGATGASVVCPSVTSAGSFSVKATATDSNGGSGQTQALAFVVYGDPSVSVTSSPRAADIGQSVTFNSAASGGTGSGFTYAWSNLPAGCPASPTTASVTCVVTTAATSSVSVTATDANGEPASSNVVTFTVSSDPTVSASESRASADTGQAVTFTAVGTPGAGTLLYSWSGLPTGCAGGSAIVTCIAPSAGNGATPFTVSVRVIDGNGMTVTSSSMTLTVFPDPTLADAASRTSADVGQSVTFTATSTLGSGGDSYVWSGLPTGCPGAPTSASVVCTVSAAGSASVTATVTDSNGFAVIGGVVAVTISVDPTIATPTASVASADVGQGVTFSAVTTSGAGGATVAWSGLPTGCGASTNNYVACPTLAKAGTFATISATITDANGFAVTSGTLSFTVFALPLPTTPTASVGSADVGQSVSFSSSATLGSGGTSWSWSGLPNGCPSNPTTATVSCSSVTVAGTFSITATATDSNGGAGRTTAIAFVVYADPTIASPTANRTSADVGQAVEFFAAASGGSGGYAYAWTALPGGCSGTGASLKCTPSTAGTTNVLVKVTDSNGVSATGGALPFTVYADPSASAPSASVASADVGQSVTFTDVAQSGSGGFSFRWTSLPTGCAQPSTLDAPTCTVTTAGTFSVEVTVTDSNGASAPSSALSYTVYADPALTPPVASASSADAGQSVTFSVTATLGSGGYAYAWLGLPAGCTGTSSATAACVVNEPVVVSAQVTDSNGVTSVSPSLAYSVFVDPSASVPMANRTSADTGQMVTFSTVASGGSGGYQYSWQGIPAACASNSPSISCVVSSTLTVSVAVTDSNGVRTTSGALGFTVYPVPTVSSPLANRTSLDAGQNVTFNASVLRAGAGGATFYWTSNSAAFVCGVSGTLAVSCRASSAGSYNVTVTVTDRNNGASVARSLDVVALADPSATAPSIAAQFADHTFDVGTMVSGSISATGGRGPYNYSWQGLPAGCTGSAPAVTCAPASSGTFQVSVWIVDANGWGFHSPTTTVVVNKALSAAVSGNRQTSTVGLAVTLNANVSGGTPAYTYSWSLGDGSAQSGPVASHEYSSAGTYTVTLWVNDSGGGHAVEYWVVSVGPAPTVLDLPAANAAQLELIAAFIILALLVVAVMVMMRRRNRKMVESSAPPVQAWQGKPPAAPAKPMPASKTNIDQTLAELEAISEDGGPNDP